MNQQFQQDQFMQIGGKQFKTQQLAATNKPKPIIIEKVPMEKLSAGQMVDCQRAKVKKLKEQKIDNIHGYLPLEENDLKLQIYLPPPETFKSKFEAFDRIIEEETQNQARYCQRIQREREAEPNREEEVKPSKRKDDSFYHTDNLAVLETGVQADGQAMFTGAHMGLGYVERRQGDEVTKWLQHEKFDRFRQKQSYSYHQNAEDRSSQKVDSCYKCNVAGHIARDCKQGLT